MDGATVVIIGAGPGGLTAAYELLENARARVIVLEASGDIGGISKTVAHKGNRIDIGGHRFFQQYMLARPGSSDGLRSMQTVRCGNDHSVQIIVLEQGSKIGVDRFRCLQMVSMCEVRPSLCGAAQDGPHRGFGVLVNGWGMLVISDSAGTKDGDVHAIRGWGRPQYRVPRCAIP